MEKLLRTLVALVKFFSRRTGEWLEAYFELPLIEQKIADSKVAMSNAAVDLATANAEKDALEDEIEEIQESIDEFFELARQAEEKGQTDLVNDTAAMIAKRTNKLERKKAILADLDDEITQLESELSEQKEKIEQVETETILVKTRESVTQAQEKMENAFDGASSSVAGVVDSLNAIKKRQQKKASERKHLKRLQKSGSDEELRAKFEEAGIRTSDDVTSEDILAKIKASTPTASGIPN